MILWMTLAPTVYFLIPKDERWSAGEMAIRDVTGQERGVDADWVRQWRVERADAMAWSRGERVRIEALLADRRAERQQFVGVVNQIAEMDTAPLKAFLSAYGLDVDSEAWSEETQRTLIAALGSEGELDVVILEALERAGLPDIAAVLRATLTV